MHVQNFAIAVGLHFLGILVLKVENILKSSLNSIPTPSPSVNFKLREGKFVWGVCSKVCWQSPAIFCLITSTFPPIIWIFTKGGGDGNKSRLSFYIFSTLLTTLIFNLILTLWLSTLTSVTSNSIHESATYPIANREGAWHSHKIYMKKMQENAFVTIYHFELK
jgi:hypothetical protein